MNYQDYNKSSVRAFEGGITLFDFFLNMGAGSNRSIYGILSYRADLYEDPVALRIVKEYELLLGAMVRNPDRRITDSRIVPELERQQVLIEWNGLLQNRSHSCLHELFQSQVERTPDASAIICDQGVLSYHELNYRANQVAHYLRHLGIGPEETIGLCLEISSDRVIALLGILKAGAAFFAPDTALAPDRISSMLRNLSVRILLAPERLRSILTWIPAQSIWIDTQWDLISQHSGADSNSGSQPESIAYIAFTTGSADSPKGVMVSHNSICSYVLSFGEALGLAATDRLIQRTPAASDAALSEVFSPLVAGASLIAERRVEPIVPMISQHQVTVLQIEPSSLKSLLEEPELERCPSLRIVACRAEALRSKLRTKVFEQLNADLFHLYGVTETTISASLHKCTRGCEHQTASIGRPIANTQVYVLSPHLQLVAVGVAGDLYIGGAGVARGYVNRADQTANAFIPDPYGGLPGSRLFNTGDAARHLYDGQVEFLGSAYYGAK
ncbi:MAG: AMP-binding protein, partial [Blastocatellia bacterium]